MDKNKEKNRKRLRRRRHVRNKLRGDAQRPRLSIYRSNQNVGAQLIDDETGKTIASASTRDKAVSVTYGGNCDAAAQIGKSIAEKAIAAGVKAVRFDRGHLKYHGRVAALADAAREAGLQF